MKKKIVEFVRSSSDIKKVSKGLLKLGRRLDVNLEIIVVVEPVVTTEPSGTLPYKNIKETEGYYKLLEETEKEVQQVIRSWEDHTSGIEVSFKVKPNRLEDLIEKKSKESDTYMIVLPDDDFMEDVSILSFFDKFSQLAHCPILRLPSGYNIDTFSKILYATDYLEEDRMKLKTLIEIASAFNASITMLHVNEDIASEEAKNLVKYSTLISEELDYPKINIDTIFYSDISQAVSDYAKTNGFDLVVVLREKKGFLQNLFTKSESVEITKASSQPVLMFYE